jgi:hypothetical protein
MNNLIPVSIQEEIERQVAEIAKSADTIVLIETDVQLQNSAALLVGIKRWNNRIEEERKSLVKPMNDQVGAINAYFKEKSGRLSEIEVNLKNSISRYHSEQEKKREADRIAAEAIADAERKKLELKAGRLSAKGKEDAAMAVSAQARSVVAVMAEQPKKAVGTYEVDVWDVDIVDVPAFLRYCADLVEKNPSESCPWIMFEEARIAKYAQATNWMNPIPGVMATKTKQLRVRSK